MPDPLCLDTLQCFFTGDFYLPGLHPGDGHKSSLLPDSKVDL